ncbi:MAG TPA: PD-(D/E)XK nuclease-like domain-containing protein, partial [Xanthobacteraceae bacterium]|nr:PD-(D/E)XK nuclease-like domain-containing protein [Xanthobacteraceae bacterium]
LDVRRPIVESTPAQLAGELTHCGTLEPGEYPFRYAVGPEVSRATKEWKEFAARHPNHVCIKPAQHAAAMAQAASIRAHPEVGKLLAKGEPEVSVFWRDPETGVYCQCRPDWVHPVGNETMPGAILVDVKTYADASPAEFARQVGRMRYHWQAAWYSDGYAIATGVPVVGFVFVAVETDWPYAACAVMLDEESLDVARRELRPLVRLFEECNASGQWPGYSPAIEQIELPRWYAARIEA